MTQSVFPALLVVGMLLLGPSALAQRTGSHMGAPAAATPSKPNTADGMQRLLYEYASCVIHDRRSTVETYLASAPESPEADHLWRSIAVKECFTVGALTLTDAGFRAGAYDRLYELDFGRNGPLDLAARKAVDYRQGRPLLLAPADLAVKLRLFSDCVVRAAPARVQKLVLTRVASPSEDKAYAPLAPVMNSCLLKTSRVTIAKPALRGLLAESLYRVSRSPVIEPAKDSAK